jgi:hypothetical protein
MEALKHRKNVLEAAAELWVDDEVEQEEYLLEAEVLVKEYKERYGEECNIADITWEEIRDIQRKLHIPQKIQNCEDMIEILKKIITVFKTEKEPKKPTKKEKRQKDSVYEKVYKDFMNSCVENGLLKEDWTHITM